MKYTTDKYASYIYIKAWDDKFKPLKSKSIGNDVVLDYSKDGELVGIEILAPLELDEE